MAKRKPFSSDENIALQAAVNEYDDSSWNDIPCLVPVLFMQTARGLKERWNGRQRKKMQSLGRTFKWSNKEAKRLSK